MSHPSIYEININFLLRERERFAFPLWTTQVTLWSHNGPKRAEYPDYVAAQVSDQISIWLFANEEARDINCDGNAPGFYRGWPIEIRGFLPPPPKARIDFSAITREICGVR